MNTMEATTEAASASPPLAMTTVLPSRSSKASASALSARLWLSPSDRRRLTKLQAKLKDLTGRNVSQSVMLRAGISALDIQAEMTEVDRKRQPGATSKRELQLLWAFADAGSRIGDVDR